MKTTLVIDDGVMRQIKQEAVRQGTTISELVEAALRRLLEDRSRRSRPSLSPLPSFRGGVPEVDIADREALYEVMETNVDPRAESR